MIRTQTGFTGNGQIGTNPSLGQTISQLTNQGLISSQTSGRTITVNPTVFVNEGIVQVTNGASVTFSGTFDNRGTLDVSSGTAIINGAYTHRENAVLKGSGIVQIGTFVNEASVRPGNSPGILTIDGNYTQTADGILEIEVGGTTPGTLHDQLHVTGTATLDGRLDLPLVEVPGFPVYTPTIGDDPIVFLQADGGVTGEFNSVFLPDLPAGVAHEIQYNANDVTLRFVAPEPIHLVSTAPVGALWSESEDWKKDDDDTNALPVSKSSVSVDNRTLTGEAQLVDVTGTNRYAHQLTVGDPTADIAVRVEDVNLSVAVGTVIEDHGAIELGNGAPGSVGTIVSQSVEVESGGFLAGNGTIKTNTLTVSGGTVSPGFSVGHLDVQGNYQMGTSSTLVVDVDRPDSDPSGPRYDTVSVTGGVNLGGTLRVQVSDSSKVHAGDTVTLIDTSQGISDGSTFDRIETTGTNGLYFALNYPYAASGAASGASLSFYVATGTFYPLGDMDKNTIAFEANDLRLFALALRNNEAYRAEHTINGACICQDGWEAGDFDQNYVLDFDDIRGWATASGSSLTVTLAEIDAYFAGVPEPNPVALMLSGAILLQFILRRRRIRGCRRMCYR